MNKRPITAREFATRKYKPRNYTYRHNSTWKVRVSAFLEGVEWARKTDDLICDFGKHKGQRWTRIPVSYLKWVSNEKNHKCGPIARAELARRGSVTPTIEVSGHAIDRASLNCRSIWHATRGDDEGLHGWLCRLAQEALLKGENINDEKYEWAGMLLVYEVGELYPVLKTVMPARKKAQQ